MEFDVSDADRKLICHILREYGPLDMSPEQEERLTRFAELLEHCGAVGSTLHVN